MPPVKSTEPRLSLRRLARTRRSASRPTGTARTVARTIAFRARRAAAALAVADGTAVLRRATVSFGHAVHRARLLHLLTRADRIAFLQKLRERGAGALGDCVL